MIIKKDYRLIDGNSFIKAFYNPSPGNPEAKFIELHNQFLYATWEDGDKTRVKIDSVEVVYDEDDETEEVGLYLWLGDNSIYLKRSDDDEDEYDGELDDDDFDDEGFEDD